jgi:hypothetical protein
MATQKRACGGKAGGVSGTRICDSRFLPPRLGALPERWRQIGALVFSLHEHGTLDGEAMKLILDRSADVACYWWSNAR